MEITKRSTHLKVQLFLSPLDITEWKNILPNHFGEISSNPLCGDLMTIHSYFNHMTH